MGTAKRILIVDDDPDIRTYVSEVLPDNAYEAVSACDGAGDVEETSDPVGRRPPGP